MCICGDVSDETAPLERLLNSYICCACTIWQERDSRKEPSHQIGVIAWQCSLTRCYSINLKKMSRVALCWPSFSMKLSPWNRMFFFTGLSSKWKNKMLIFWLESGLFFLTKWEKITIIVIVFFLLIQTSYTFFPSTDYLYLASAHMHSHIKTLGGSNEYPIIHANAWHYANEDWTCVPTSFKGIVPIHDSGYISAKVLNVPLQYIHFTAVSR